MEIFLMAYFSVGVSIIAVTCGNSAHYFSVVSVKRQLRVTEFSDNKIHISALLFN
jgi:hypothetical protein